MSGARFFGNYHIGLGGAIGADMPAYPRYEDAYFTFLTTAKRTADFFHGAKIMASGEWRVMSIYSFATRRSPLVINLQLLSDVHVLSL